MTMQSDALLLLLALVVLLLVVLSVNRRIQLLEAKVNRLLALQGVDVDTLPVPSEEILALARRGEKIAAIKAYRGQTFAGLKDAKNMIERHCAAAVKPDA